MKKLIGMAVVSLWALSALSAVTVTNLVAAQRPGTKLVDITYDIFSTETNAVKVFLAVSRGTNAVSATNLTGDIGAGVATGTGKSIVWDMGADWNGNVETGVVFTVTGGVPAGGDPLAVDWDIVNTRWVKNTYANGDVTISDKNTGIMWLYNAKITPHNTWNYSMSFCDGLVYAGYSDWRLPDVSTLSAQYTQTAFFINVQGEYWSSTDGSPNELYAYEVYMNSGFALAKYKTYGNPYVWPIRDEPAITNNVAASAVATADVNSCDYTLMVNSGTGGGSYPYQQQVTITANEPAAGYTFNLWTGDTQYVANVASSSTTLTMPAQAVSVAASYAVSGGTFTPTNLVNDSFDGSTGSLPDASKFEWGGQVAQTGSGQLNLSTDTANQSWLKSKAGAAPGSGQILILKMRAYAYAEPAVYGDLQPRGLRVGSDANNSVEFYSIYGTTLGMRVRKNGVESMVSYAFPAGVSSMHDYEIAVTTTSVVFKVDGALAGTLTNNIPNGVLNFYGSTYDGGFGNVPVSIDSLSLLLTDSQDADGDEIPDSWEQLYFGSTGTDPSAVCSNGVNTVLEAYIAGLNPKDPQSTLRAAVPSNGQMIDWNAVSGRVYSVYWTTNLMSSFQCLESNIPWTQGCFTNSAAVSSGYYKIGVRLEN